jgi:hypothetical protein
MNTFINKNILLDEIFLINNSLFINNDTSDTMQLLYNLNELADSIDIKNDMILFEHILILIDNIIFDTEAYFSYISEYNIKEIDLINEILYGLNSTKFKINQFINIINSTDTLTDLFDNLNI